MLHLLLLKKFKKIKGFKVRTQKNTYLLGLVINHQNKYKMQLKGRWYWQLKVFQNIPAIRKIREDAAWLPRRHSKLVESHSFFRSCRETKDLWNQIISKRSFFLFHKDLKPSPLQFSTILNTAHNQFKIVCSLIPYDNPLSDKFLSINGTPSLQIVLQTSGS